MQLELIISVYKEELRGQLWALHIVDCLLHIKLCDFWLWQMKVPFFVYKGDISFSLFNNVY